MSPKAEAVRGNEPEILLFAPARSASRQSSKQMFQPRRARLPNGLCGGSATVDLNVALLNLESKPLIVGFKVTYLAFEYCCLTVTIRKVLHEQRKSVTLNEQRMILLNKPLHDNCGSDVFCHSCAR